MTVLIENDLYVVAVPEHGIRQEINPDTRAPFASAAEAQNWQDATLAAIEQHQATANAEAETAEQVRLSSLIIPRHVTPGAFKDRLGPDALAIAVSAHPACVAVREMLYDRRYVDLDSLAVAQLLGLLVATAQPDPHPLFDGSGPMTQDKATAIIAAPVQEIERP